MPSVRNGDDVVLVVRGNCCVYWESKMRKGLGQRLASVWGKDIPLPAFHHITGCWPRVAALNVENV